MTWLLRALSGSPRQTRFSLELGELVLRPALAEDFAQWAALRAESRAFLEPWEPLWPEDDLTEASFRARLQRSDEEMLADLAYPLLIFRAADPTLLGGITLSNIRRRAAQTATLGYWMGARHAGKGAMSRAVGGLCGHAFASLGLERLEAACLPGNAASIRVLVRNGFRQEGYAREYLAIAGRRQDHVLFARLRSDAAGPVKPDPALRAR